jgi:glycerophosphoryl diester phosphodiesterase
MSAIQKSSHHVLSMGEEGGGRKQIRPVCNVFVKLSTCEDKTGEGGAMALISAHSGHGEGVATAGYESFRQVLDSGAEYAEIDIRKTSDNVLVAYHDAYIPALGKLLADLDYEEICAHLGYAVPKVADVMSMLAGKFIGHLDLKETGHEAEVIELALATFGPGNFVATTLEEISVRRIKEAFPEVRAALSLGRDLAGVPRSRWAALRLSELLPVSRIRACGADWVAVHHRLARLGVLRSCQRHGVGAMVWTVDSDPLIDRFLCDPRVDVLITNRPAHAVSRRMTLAAAGAAAS